MKRIFVQFAVVAASLFVLASAHAQSRQVWCLNWEGELMCSYSSLAQCLLTQAGMGGACLPDSNGR